MGVCPWPGALQCGSPFSWGPEAHGPQQQEAQSGRGVRPRPPSPTPLSFPCGQASRNDIDYPLKTVLGEKHEAALCDPNLCATGKLHRLGLKINCLGRHPKEKQIFGPWKEPLNNRGQRPVCVRQLSYLLHPRPLPWRPQPADAAAARGPGPWMMFCKDSSPACAPGFPQQRRGFPLKINCTVVHASPPGTCAQSWRERSVWVEPVQGQFSAGCS